MDVVTATAITGELAYIVDELKRLRISMDQNAIMMRNAIGGHTVPVNRVETPPLLNDGTRPLTPKC